MGASFLNAIIGGFVTGLSTIIGALPVRLQRSSALWNPWRILNLDFALGMMIIAAMMNLIVPAYRSAEPALLISSWILVGLISMRVLSRILHRSSPAHWKNHGRTTLFIIAMMLHNFPEGMASGAALSDSILDARNWGVVIAIVLQNFPEGLATAAAFLSLGVSRKAAFWGAALTGFVEILGGLISGLFAAITHNSLPSILAFAGGAMLIVTLEEISHKVQEQGLRYLIRRDFLLGLGLILILNLTLLN